ncbi:MAG: endonuclease/exonuclease/phosphatase family protein [Bacteroidales bacterium]|nr:endonuclease/exonuclease/phosphatase family protein [Bacteroidales bacterium]
MLRFLRHIIIYINVLFALLLLASVLSPLIPPGFLRIAPFLGLMFPFLLIINVFFVVYWAVSRRLALFISLAVILAGSVQIKRFVRFPFANIIRKETGENKSACSGDSLRILTYNVRAFNLYDWAHNKDAARGILHFVDSLQADVLCFQEFYSRAESRLTLKEIPQGASLAPHAYFYYYFTDHQGGRYGIATYSRYPILRKGAIRFENTYNVCIYTDLLFGKDTIRVYNAHLQSVRFRKANYDFLDTLRLTYSDRHLQEVKDIYSRLREAYLKRSEQVTQIARHIASCVYPVIVCGDLNDTPVSYTYRIIRGRLNDTFTEAGSGLSYTYNLPYWPFFRIDYILSDPVFSVAEMNTLRIPYSDHFPVLATLVLPEQTADSANQRFRPKE